jgi:CelD/BcsL family acetyltransferase involved in cellulose biosynthesis
VAPLARPDVIAEVAEAFGAVLAERASAVRFEAIPSNSPFPRLLAERWPRRPRPAIQVDSRNPGLVTATRASFDDWRRTRSSSYRRQQNRRRGQIERAGGLIRRSQTPDQLEADLLALFRLHHARFASQGRDTLLDAYRPAVIAACRALFDRGEGARLWVVEIGGEVIGAQLFVRVGSRMSAWNGGFDPARDRLSPGFVLHDEGVRDAHELGCASLDWGVGDDPHKRHFADADDPISWTTLIARDAQYPLTRAVLLPRHARDRVMASAQRLPPGMRHRLKRLARI